MPFYFDGFDEFPEHLWENISGIANCDILPLCGLIVSSCPHASVSLRKQAVDILGFTYEEHHHYNEQSLKGQPQSIEKLIPTTYKIIPLSATSV